VHCADITDIELTTISLPNYNDVSQKIYLTFDHNFGKDRLIFKTLSLSDL